MLEKYGILSLKGTTNDIKRLLEQNKFKENKDYLLRNVAQQVLSGTKYKNEYYLHPRSFKICLMRSLKTREYAYYYILLEECIKYFNDYQNELNNKYIIKLKTKIEKKDNKICKLEEKLDKLLEDNKETKKSNDETKIINEKLLKSNDETKIINEKLLKYNEKILYKLNKLENQNNELENQNNELIDSVEDLKDDNEEIHHKLDITIKKLDISTEERVINPNNKQKLENFIIFKSRKKNIDFKYYVIRCQIRNTASKVKRLEDDKYKNVLELNNVTNSIKFWNFIKEKYKNNLIFDGNNFNIINIDNKVLLDNINSSYNNRKNIDLDIYEELED